MAFPLESLEDDRKDVRDLFAQDVRGSVGRAVGGDDDLEAVLRIGQETEVFQLGGKVGLLITCSDDDGDRGRDRLLNGRAADAGGRRYGAR